MVAELLFVIVLLSLLKLVVDVLTQPKPEAQRIPIRVERRRR